MGRPPTYTLDDARKWLDMYDYGFTIEEISLELGISMVTIRTWLVKLPEFTPRPVGQRPGTVSANRSNAVSKAERPTGVHHVHQLASKPKKGYRRRGRKL